MINVSTTPEPKAVPVIWFTGRELQLMRLAASDRSLKQVADEMGLAAVSVRDLASRLYAKLDVSDYRGLTVWVVLHQDDIRAGYTRDRGVRWPVAA